MDAKTSSRTLTVLLLIEGGETEAIERAVAGDGRQLLRLPTVPAELEVALRAGGDLLVADARLLGRRGIAAALHRACADVPLLLLTDRPREEAELLSLRPAARVRYSAPPHHPAALRGLADQLLRDRVERGAAPPAPASLQSEREARERAEYARTEAEAVTRSKDEFLATFSHELRTPLTSILGWARMLRLGRAAADAGGPALQSIERNARLLAGLTEDLLDLQRAASGRLTVRFSELDLSALVESAVASLRPTAENASLSLAFRPPDQELRVFGDAGRLSQVVTNLLTNAIKFTPAGGRIQVGLQPAEADVLLTVQDSGLGISPEFIGHVFEPFRQEDSSLSRDQGGLGLGLALVRELVEAHGGTVSVDSAGKGRGSLFTVALPLRSKRPRTQSAQPHRAAAEEGLGSRLQGAHVLLVEDDADARYLISSMLEQAGARVAHAASAAEGFELAMRNSFELLVSDVSMPGEDGYSLMRRIRAETRNGHVMAVALTANARSEDRDRALAAGFQLHVAKPVEPDALIRELSALIGRG